MEITDKQIVKSRIVNQSTNELWWKWTTHEGLKTFLGIDNKIKLALGGTYEIYFLMDNPYGLKGSENCKIISYIPKKMISFTWNAPPQFPAVRYADYSTWVVVEFDEINESETKITLTHTGWPKGEEWEAVYEYFEKAWDMVIDSLCGK